MNLLIVPLVLVAVAAADAPAGQNAVFKDLIDHGVKMSDGAAFRLPPPILADGLDAAGQRAAIANAPRARRTVAEMLGKSFYAPVEAKVRTLKAPQNDGPAVRAIDVWFVAHGDWTTLNSKQFLDSAMSKEEGKSRIVLKSGILSDQEMAKRKLSATADGTRSAPATTTKGGTEERFVYTTFWLFERVEISATRRTALAKGKDFILAAGRIDSRFDRDPDYPNQWRPLLRDAQAEIRPGPAHPFSHAGGYAKITRLREPADAVFVECHVVYEEDYGWFDGANLVKQKVPVMVQEKVRIFRRKLAVASEAKK
jgi:hypothetical protein